MNRTCAVIIACALVFAVTACGRQEADTAADAGQTTRGTEASLPPPDQVLPHETVRVAIRTEANANPLLSKHYTSQALFRLVYEPLYEPGVDGRLEGVLAESLRWSSDGLTATVTLREDRLFHDGSPVTAEDAAASLIKYLALQQPAARGEELIPEEGEEEADEGGEQAESYDLSSLFEAAAFSLTEAYRLDSLANIISVESGGSRRLVIGLERPDPTLAGLLTFPVIPADKVHARSWAPVAGTGPWSLLSSDKGGFVLAAVAEGDAPLRQIEARSFRTVAEAVAAFETGEIDLLLMDSSETALFADRSRIRKQRFDDGGFISLFFAGQREGALTLRDGLLYVLASDPLYEKMAAPLNQAAYPVLAGDYRLAGTRIPRYRPDALPEGYLTDTADREEDPAGKPEDSDRQPFRLLVPEAYLPERLIDNIGRAVQALNRRLAVIRVGAEGWQSALKSGQYEAALLVDWVDRFPDPVDYLEGLAAAGLYKWEEVTDPEDRALLLEARRFMVEAGEESPTAAAYSSAVARIFEMSPVLGLASSGTMVWYSDQVEGTMTGTWRSPYEGVEDLFIWRQ